MRTSWLRVTVLVVTGTTMICMTVTTCFCTDITISGQGSMHKYLCLYTDTFLNGSCSCSHYNSTGSSIIMVTLVHRRTHLNLGLFNCCCCCCMISIIVPSICIPVVAVSVIAIAISIIAIPVFTIPVIPIVVPTVPCRSRVCSCAC